MKILMLTGGAGPAEGHLLSAARRAGHEYDVLDVAGLRWLAWRGRGRGPSFYRWATQWPLRSARTQVARVVRRAVELRRYDLVITSGLAAGGFAARYLEEPFVPLLFRGDLDFSAARTMQTEDFSDLTTAVDRLYFDDEWEFDKAASKNSRSAHRRHLRVPVDAASIAPLSRDPGPAHVVVLHPERVDEERLSQQCAALGSAVAGVPGATLRSLSASALYRARDLAAGRGFDAVARARLDGATHVVMVGASRDHGPVGQLLCATGFADRLVVEETIGMADWAQAHPQVRRGRGVRLVSELAASLTGESLDSAGNGHQPGIEGEADLFEAYRTDLAERADRHAEDLAFLKQDGPVDVFFSTSPLEDRTDGARPQRVRNMHDAMSAAGPALRLSSVPGVFDRRVRALRTALNAGRPAGLFYGENSTSPIPVERVRDELAQVMEQFGAAGGTTVWFVRDLHWLDDIDGYLDDHDARQDIQRRGLAELDTMAAAADHLAAPSDEAGAGFTALLQRHGRSGYDWLSLPPAVAPANVVPDAREGSRQSGVTLLYAGGVNAIYGLSTYLEAVAQLPAETRLDFVVRAAEREQLEEQLRAHGLADREGLRISTVALEWYVPTTETVIGAILLGGDYAAFSFPYKTMSLVERGYPLLCFDDMAIADVVTDNDLGRAVPRTAEAVRAGLMTLVDSPPSGTRRAQVEHTWESRIDRARAAGTSNG
ncbi:MAG: hypothetical protein Q4G34_05705 [Micrococcus sp.]|nr:hypothetical protein [Micrococcus sp.]